MGGGAQLNYTAIDSDLTYNTEEIGPQVAILGISESANMIVFYEKYGWQLKAAYNWRDKYLSGLFVPVEVNQPNFRETYSQWDFCTAFTPNFLPGLTAFVEGINVTKSTQRVHARYQELLLHAEQFGARYRLDFKYVY